MAFWHAALLALPPFGPVHALAADEAGADAVRAARALEVPGAAGCRRSFGLAVGGYGASGSDWDQVGSAFSPTISPMIAASCAFAVSDQMLLWGGAESAPWYIQVGLDGDLERQWATSRLGVLYGSRKVRVGADVTGGFYGAGAGLTIQLTPGEDEEKPATFDLRVGAYRLGAPGIQAVVLYSTYPEWPIARGKRR